MVILSLTWRRLTRNGALAGILVGAATVLFWIYAPVLEGAGSPYEPTIGFSRAIRVGDRVVVAGTAPVGLSLVGQALLLPDRLSSQQEADRG